MEPSGGSLHVLFAADGTTFTEQPLPPTPDGWRVDSTKAVVNGDRYVVIVQLNRPIPSGEAESQAIAYVSTDGTTWTPSELPGGLSVITVGALADGTIAAAGYGGNGMVDVALFRDGAWQSSTVSDLDLGGDVVLSGFAPSVGPLGVALTVTIGRPTGAGPAPPNTGLGDVTTVVGYASPDGRPIDQSSVREVLLFSSDGLTWSMTDLDALGPEPGSYLAGVTVTDSNVLVRYAGPSSGEPDAPLPEQALYVATPQ